MKMRSKAWALGGPGSLGTDAGVAGQNSSGQT